MFGPRAGFVVLYLRYIVFLPRYLRIFRAVLVLRLRWEGDILLPSLALSLHYLLGCISNRCPLVILFHHQGGDLSL